MRVIDFDQSCSPVAHADSFRINIAIAAMHRLNTRILDVIIVFQNTNIRVHEIFYVCPPPYYLGQFGISYPNVPLNQYEGPFCLQYMNGIQEKNPDGRQWNQLLDAVVTIIKYKKSTIDNSIYIRVLSG